MLYGLAVQKEALEQGIHMPCSGAIVSAAGSLPSHTPPLFLFFESGGGGRVKRNSLHHFEVQT